MWVVERSGVGLNALLEPKPTTTETALVEVFSRAVNQEEQDSVRHIAGKLGALM
jgi:hypothetical protein